MRTLRRLAMNYYFDTKVLYKRSSNGTLLRCLDGTEEKKSTPRSSQRGLYFLMTMERDWIEYISKYHKYQVYNDKINVPSTPLFNLTSQWPFAKWGINVIRHVNLKANSKHRFILVAKVVKITILTRHGKCKTNSDCKIVKS